MTRFVGYQALNLKVLGIKRVLQTLKDAKKKKKYCYVYSMVLLPRFVLRGAFVFGRDRNDF